MKFRALSDFEVHYPHPLEVRVGDSVAVEKRDTTWREWVWVTLEGERVGAWVHESVLEDASASRTQVRQAFSSRELSVKKGDVVESLSELGGWHWCVHSDGDEGWIPDYVIEAIANA